MDGMFVSCGFWNRHPLANRPSPSLYQRKDVKLVPYPRCLKLKTFCFAESLYNYMNSRLLVGLVWPTTMFLRRADVAVVVEEFAVHYWVGGHLQMLKWKREELVLLFLW